MSPASPALAAHLATPIRLFIADATLLGQTAAALKELGFANVSAVRVPASYFQAMRQLFAELMRLQDGVILVNHPPKQMKDAGGIGYADLAFGDFYAGVASLMKNTRRSAADLLGACIPIFVSAQDHDIRLRIVEELFPFGVVGAFMLRVQDMFGDKTQQRQERVDELHDYLLEYFQTRKGRLLELREYKSAEELKNRRAQAEQIMAEVQKLKESKDFDKAIALCRQAIEALPTDPEAYLEGGRLLVKRKKYAPAMEMLRDAEKVAEELPAPNQEIANLRVEQVKDYVEKKRALGQPPDPAVIQGFLEEAEQNYRLAIDKAASVVTARSGHAVDKRKDMAAAIAENILTLELGQVLGEANPMVRRLGRLAQQTLSDKVGGDGVVSPRHMIQFGLGAFFDGDVDTAERYLKQAAKSPEHFHDACSRLNYIGMQLRQQGKVDRSIKLYRALLELRPSFRGVVLFNLAVAMQSKALEMAAVDSARSLEVEIEAVGRAVEAIYIDPNLPADENFYQNTVIAPRLARIIDIFGQSPAVSDQSTGPADAACRAATLRLEGLLRQGQDRQALQLLFSLAQKLRPYFLEFDRHASRPVADFAARLHPLLVGHDQPKMRVFGKILGVLVSRGALAPTRGSAPPPPELTTTQQALERADQPGAAKEMAKAFYRRPELAGHPGLTAEPTLSNLCREIAGKLAKIDCARFVRKA